MWGRGDFFLASYKKKVIFEVVTRKFLNFREFRSLFICISMKTIIWAINYKLLHLWREYRLKERNVNSLFMKAQWLHTSLPLWRPFNNYSSPLSWNVEESLSSKISGEKEQKLFSSGHNQAQIETCTDTKAMVYSTRINISFNYFSRDCANPENRRILLFCLSVTYRRVF